MIYVYIKYIFFLKRKWWLIAFFGNCWHLVWPQATRNKGKTGRVLATRESVWIQYLFHFPQVFSSTLRPNSTTKSPLSLSLFLPHERRNPNPNPNPNPLRRRQSNPASSTQAAEVIPHAAFLSWFPSSMSSRVSSIDAVLLFDWFWFDPDLGLQKI